MSAPIGDGDSGGCLVVLAKGGDQVVVVVERYTKAEQASIVQLKCANERRNPGGGRAEGRKWAATQHKQQPERAEKRGSVGGTTGWRRC